MRHNRSMCGFSSISPHPFETFLFRSHGTQSVSLRPQNPKRAAPFHLKWSKTCCGQGETLPVEVVMIFFCSNKKVRFDYWNKEIFNSETIKATQPEGLLTIHCSKNDRDPEGRQEETAICDIAEIFSQWRK